MSKNEFIRELESRIKKYPDHNEVISYYYELIQDKIDSGMTEDEAVESLGSLDEIVKEIELNNDNVKDEVIAEEIKEEKTEEVKAEVVDENKPKRINGGKRFVYVLWVIATVFMCIAAITTLVVSICFMVGTVGLMLSSGLILAQFESLALSGFQFGLGLFLFGAALVAVYYSRVLVKFIFREKRVWTTNIRKGLGGE